MPAEQLTAAPAHPQCCPALLQMPARRCHTGGGNQKPRVHSEDYGNYLKAGAS